MIKGIIFDVDGTLLDSMHIWGELGKRYLSSVGMEAKPGLAKLLFPMSLDESSEYLKNEYNFPDSVEQITEDTIKILSDFYRYLRAAEILGTVPGETAVFEDVLHAIKAAKTAGFVTWE